MAPKNDRDARKVFTGHAMFMDFFHRKKVSRWSYTKASLVWIDWASFLQTFRPRKHFTPGTLKYSLHKRAIASFESEADLKRTVQLPKGENLEDWIAIYSKSE